VRITAFELPAAWGEPARVLAEVDARLARGPATDLVLLPEQAITGYIAPDLTCELAPFAEPPDGPTARALAALAAAHGVHLVAPLVLREGGAIYNAMACFDPRGAPVFTYRKRHPWFPEAWATPGPDAPPIAELCGRRVTIAICYDLHFLLDDAPVELATAELLLFPSAWVERVDRRAEHLARLAHQFGVYVVNANWAPGVVRVHGQGGSCIIGPGGAVLARAPLAGRVDWTI
jgi:predicted amidohydrolase